MYFRDKYEMLSNFFPCVIKLDDGTICRNVETAYQAMKMADPRMRKIIANSFDAAQAKRLGNQLPMNPAWEAQLNLAVPFGDELWPTKAWIMWSLLNQKFEQSAFMDALRVIPLETPIVEHNTWHDNYWGSCTCARCGDKGLNMLGRMISRLRVSLMRDDMADQSPWGFEVVKQLAYDLWEPARETKCTICGSKGSTDRDIKILVTCSENDKHECFCEACGPEDYYRALELPRFKAPKLYEAIRNIEVNDTESNDNDDDHCVYLTL